MALFGQRTTFGIEVEPLALPPDEADQAAAATWCRLRLWIDGRNVTRHVRTGTDDVLDGLNWPAAYLARWLVRAWPSLWERAGTPTMRAQLDPETACRLLDEAVIERGDDADDLELDDRDAFVFSHTLLAGAAGSMMPPVYLLREGGSVQLVCRPTPSNSPPQVQFLETVSRFAVGVEVFLETADAFVAWCIDVVGDRAPEFSQEARRWREHVTGPDAAERVLRGYVFPWLARGEPPTAARLEAALDLPPSWRQAGARLRPDMIPVAALYRAVAPCLRPEDIDALLVRLRSLPRNPAADEALDALTATLNPPWQGAPHEQGYVLATQLRELIHNQDGYFDVEAYVTELGIAVVKEPLTDSSIDAVTVWDATHGPVIVLNTTSRRSKSWAERMSLAHELCHLLVDRHRGQPLMVASTPWTPPEPERRANAFAAELLLPRAGLLRLRRATTGLSRFPQDDPDALMDEFHVGLEVCKWQLNNRLRIVDLEP